MNNRLWMYQYLYLLGIDTEEPLGLNHFEALVHHRSRINGNLCAHIPGRMFQSISLRHVGYLLHRLQTERTAGSRQQDLFYRVHVLAHKTLEDGRVLAVDGQDGGVILLGQLQNQLASHHQRLLIG